MAILYVNWKKVFLWQINVFLYEIFPSPSRFLYIISFQYIWASKVEAGIILRYAESFWISQPWCAYKGYTYKTNRVYYCLFSVVTSPWTRYNVRESGQPCLSPLNREIISERNPLLVIIDLLSLYKSPSRYFIKLDTKFSLLLA